MKEFTVTIEEEPNNYIDQYGNPYDHESGDSWPAGGGLDKRCDYNAEALYAYYVLKNQEAIAKFLKGRGFEWEGGYDCAVWHKGNTDIYFECYDADNDGGLYGYLHTELAEED